MAQITGPNPGTLGQVQDYYVINHQGISFSWSVQKGTIVSGQGTSHVEIQWDTLGQANLSVLITKRDSQTENTVIVIDVMEG